MNKLFAFILLVALATTVSATCANASLAHCDTCASAAATTCTNCVSGYNLDSTTKLCTSGSHIAFAVLALFAMLFCWRRRRRHTLERLPRDITQKYKYELFCYAVMYVLDIVGCFHIYSIIIFHYYFGKYRKIEE